MTGYSQPLQNTDLKKYMYKYDCEKKSKSCFKKINKKKHEKISKKIIKKSPKKLWFYN